MIAFLWMMPSLSLGAVKNFGELLCHSKGYHCHKVTRQESWSSLFPSDKTRDLVKRLNRQNVFLTEGMVIAVPDHVERLSLLELSPFPRYRRPFAEPYILLNLKQQAFAAYDATGELVLWGPISSGAHACLEEGQSCDSPRGDFRIIRKEGADCVSKTYPVKLNGQKGGGEMAYCMYFHKGYALHASEDLPGFAASHGCIRLFSEDARFLNEHFVRTSHGKKLGTRVIIQ